MRKQGVSYFHMEMSAFELTPEYKKLRQSQPNTYFIWEDYALYTYVSDGVYKPLQIHVTPNSIMIFKEDRKAKTDFIYNWNGVVREYDGERFCDSHDEFVLLTAIGDWFRNQLVQLQADQHDFEFMSEVDFTKKLGISFVDHLSFQQKLKLFSRDIRKFYGYPVELQLTEYFTREFWYTGNCAKMVVTTPSAHIQLHYHLQQQKVNIYCNSAVVVDEHPMLLKVVKMLMKERAYGQVAQVLLKSEANKDKGGVL